MVAIIKKNLSLDVLLNAPVEFISNEVNSFSIATLRSGLFSSFVLFKTYSFKLCK